MKKLLSILALVAVCGTAAPAPALAAGSSAVAPAADEHDLRVRVWAENDRDYFRAGDRVRLQFRTSESGYAAVVHLDTDGEVEILYPRSPHDDGYVRGDRTYTLPYGGGSSHWSVRGAPGIGYVFAVFSEDPLDFGAFRDRYGSGWA